MKKEFLGMVMTTMMAVAAHAQTAATSGYLTIKGNLTDVKDTLVLIGSDYDNPRGSKIVDLVTKKGKFEYKVNLDKVKDLVFYTPGKEHIGKLPAIPNETVEIKGTIDNYELKGTGFYQQYVGLHNLIQQYNLMLDKARAEYTERMNAAKDEKEQGQVKSEFYEKMKTPQANLRKDMLAYLDAHKNEEPTTYILNYLAPDDYDQVLNTLSPSIVDGRMAGYFKVVKERLKMYKELKAAEKTVAPGKMAPDFTMKDIHGNDFTLSSLRGKYVILDFWGSWCVWCIKGMPKMKEYYEKYKGKFEIVGIDCNDTEAKWKAAVEKHQLPWVQVKNESTDFTVKTYAISGFPTKILVNPDGTINKTVMGEDPAFYEYLDSLFK